MADLSVVHYLITAITGAFGVGVGWSTIKFKLGSIEKRIVNVEKKQATLRGENGGEPLIVSPKQCLSLRHACHGEIDKTSVDLAEKALVNAKRIKRLENYARWTLQDRGIPLREIDSILDPD